jgi:epoxyqueuosine reductase
VSFNETRRPAGTRTGGSPLSSAEVKRGASECKFDLCGLARAEALDPAPLQGWLDAGYAADMEWMRHRQPARTDPQKVLPGAATVVALACFYSRSDEEAPKSPVARYARGRDYHYTMRDRLRRLRQQILSLDPETETYACVDTGVMMEKAWAQRAGLGWIGKNGCLIHPKYGSWLVLAVMVMDREVDAYDSPHDERCGDCRLCLDACPTAAFPRPGVVDARRCLSYHSIENRGFVPEEFRSQFGGRVFGCDVCQEVCPWNRGPAWGGDRFAPRPVARLSPAQLAGLSREEHSALTRGSAMARSQYDGLRRNALYALGAARDTQAREVAKRLCDDPNPAVRDAANWALRRIGE